MLVVFKEMKRRDVIRALLAQGCELLSEDGIHTKWGCPCGAHTTAVPRHTEITAGTVHSIGKHMACLPKGWLK